MTSLPEAMGMAVEPERIEEEISRIWSAAGEPPDREGDTELQGASPQGDVGALQRGVAEGGAPGQPASLIHVCLSNVVLHLPRSASCPLAREVLRELGRLFPSRMLLLTHGEAAAAPLQAWLSVFCHLPAPAAPPVCYEEITLQAPPGALEIFPGAVVPLLIPDVPVVLVFLEPGGEDLERLLQGVVDRVLFDSRALPLEALSRVARLLASQKAPYADDLAWRDTFGWRRALCDVFDEPRALPLLAAMDRIRVEYQGGGEGTRGAARAALVAGWLASRAGFRAADRPARPLEGRFQRAGAGLAVELAAAPPDGGGPGRLLSVTVSSGEPGRWFVRVRRAENPRVLRIESATPEVCILPRTVPHRTESEAQLLGVALERPTDQGVLREAVEAALVLAGGAR